MPATMESAFTTAWHRLLVAAAVQVRDAGARPPRPAHTAPQNADSRPMPASAGGWPPGSKARARGSSWSSRESQLARVDHQRHRHGDALVAAAGVDDDRQLAAAHARVGRRRGACAGAHLHVVAVGAQHHAADVGAPVARKPLVGYPVRCRPPAGRPDGARRPGRTVMAKSQMPSMVSTPNGPSKPVGLAAARPQPSASSKTTAPSRSSRTTLVW